MKRWEERRDFLFIFNLKECTRLPSLSSFHISLQFLVFSLLVISTVDHRNQLAVAQKD